MNSNRIECSTYMIVDSLQTVCEDGELEKCGRQRASHMNMIWHGWKALSDFFEANMSAIKAAARNSLGRDSVSKRLYATDDKEGHSDRVRRVEERAAEPSGIFRAIDRHWGDSDPSYSYND
jgi:hypothetical protein